ncbi:MAG: YfiR family protein [Candidatus Acidiferrales bacterium]
MAKVTGTTVMRHDQDMGTHRSALLRRIHRRRLGALSGLAAVLSVLLCGVPCLRAQQTKANEFEVKAAYLYNFGRFVEWPDESAVAKNESFEICVLGADPFGRTLDTTLATGTIGGKSVAAKRISKPEEIDSCRIVFISSSEESHLKTVLAALDKASVLTVSDIPRFSERGGMIGFVLDGNRVRFDVNLAIAQGARLTMSSELLKVATSVKKGS